MEDIDESEWNEAWSSMAHRRMLTWASDLKDWFGYDFGELVTVTISPVPERFIGLLHIKDEICPVCGFQTEETNRIVVGISPTFTNITGLGLHAWAMLDASRSVR